MHLTRRLANEKRYRSFKYSNIESNKYRKKRRETMVASVKSANAKRMSRKSLISHHVHKCKRWFFKLTFRFELPRQAHTASAAAAHFPLGYIFALSVPIIKSENKNRFNTHTHHTLPMPYIPIPTTSYFSFDAFRSITMRPRTNPQPPAR